jgi:hypothetical protein
MPLRPAPALLLLAAIGACAAPVGGPPRVREDRIRLAVGPGERLATDAGLERWIRGAAAGVASVVGEFPEVPLEVRVEIVRRGGRDPVVFGQAIGRGSPVVRLLLRADADDASLSRDWVAVHELLHLAMPPIRVEDAWLSEGWATWYGEVLRARGGLQTEEEAWTEILLGFERGRRGGGDRTLREESRLLHSRHAYMRVYWGGAAVALLLDAGLRRGPEGRSLDDALREMRERERGDDGEVPAEEWMARLDAWLGRPLFSRTVAPCLGSPEFPPVEPLLRELGVSLAEGRARLDDGAPAAGIRRAMTAPPAPVPGQSAR